MGCVRGCREYTIPRRDGGASEMALSTGGNRRWSEGIGPEGTAAKGRQSGKQGPPPRKLRSGTGSRLRTRGGNLGRRPSKAASGFEMDSR